MKNKRVYVNQDRYESLTIKLDHSEATFTIDELHRILMNKLYGKFELLSECCSAEPHLSYLLETDISGEDIEKPTGLCSKCLYYSEFESRKKK